MTKLTAIAHDDHTALVGPRILIVDDDAESAAMTMRLLGSGGNYRMSIAHDAAAAYAALKLAGDGPDRIDLVIMDLVMPGIDGIEATAAIRTTERGSSLPILVLSGRQDMESLGQAFMAGASEFVAKPVKAVELQARVRTLLRLGREQRRRQERERQLIASNRELQQSVFDGTLIDATSGLPSRAWAELVLRDCRARGAPVAAALVQVEELDAYIALHGAKGGHMLSEVAGRLRAVPAPLGAMLSSWSEGRFLIIAPGHRDAQRLGELCTAMQRAVEYPAIPHGNALHHDRVRVSTASAWRPASTASQLPSALIASLGMESVHGSRHVELA